LNLRGDQILAQPVQEASAHVEIPRTKVGSRQTIETLISEEALLFARFLRSEKRDWIPSVAII
jgi:hypothetical protein